MKKDFQPGFSELGIEGAIEQYQSFSAECHYGNGMVRIDVPFGIFIDDLGRNEELREAFGLGCYADVVSLARRYFPLVSRVFGQLRSSFAALENCYNQEEETTADLIKLAESRPIEASGKRGSFFPLEEVLMVKFLAPKMFQEIFEDISTREGNLIYPIKRTPCYVVRNKLGGAGRGEEKVVLSLLVADNDGFADWIDLSRHAGMRYQIVKKEYGSNI